MNFKNAIRELQNWKIGHFTKLCNENEAPAEKHGTWREMSISSKDKSKATFYSPAEAWVLPAPSLKKPEEGQFVIDSGTSMQMSSEKDLSPGELYTLRRSSNATTVITANEEAQTNEEAQVLVHDLDLFETVQILDDTLPVLSLGKLCEEHGCSYVWASGQKPHPTHNGNMILCKTENVVVVVVVPELSSSSSESSSSTSFPKTHRVPLRVQQLYEETILVIKRQETSARIKKKKKKTNKK